MEWPILKLAHIQDASVTVSSFNPLCCNAGSKSNNCDNFFLAFLRKMTDVTSSSGCNAIILTAKSQNSLITPEWATIY